MVMPWSRWLSASLVDELLEHNVLLQQALELEFATLQPLVDVLFLPQHLLLFGLLNELLQLSLQRVFLGLQPLLLFCGETPDDALLQLTELIILLVLQLHSGDFCEGVLVIVEQHLFLRAFTSVLVGVLRGISRHYERR